VEVRHISCFVLLVLFVWMVVFIFFLRWCLSLCHLFFVFLEYQRSWNGLMIATMSKFIFWKWALLTSFKCGFLYANRYQRFAGEIAAGKTWVCQWKQWAWIRILDLNTPKRRRKFGSENTAELLHFVPSRIGTSAWPRVQHGSAGCFMYKKGFLKRIASIHESNIVDTAFALLNLPCWRVM